VQDGQQVLVPRAGAAQAVGDPGSSRPGGAKPSLASATAAQLDRLDGIGPKLAKRIVDYRQSHGGFRSVDELKQVEGIGDKRFQALRDALGP
jgi:competence protein ComEA